MNRTGVRDGTTVEYMRVPSEVRRADLVIDAAQKPAPG
jgi:hypothetical protein